MTHLICQVFTGASAEPGAIVCGEDGGYWLLHSTGNHLSGYMVS